VKELDMWFKKMLGKLGYREWELVHMELRLAYTKMIYRCKVTGRTKVELTYDDPIRTMFDDEDGPLKVNKVGLT
jgi:hypothetical protein